MESCASHSGGSGSEQHSEYKDSRFGGVGRGFPGVQEWKRLKGAESLKRLEVTRQEETVRGT